MIANNNSFPGFNSSSTGLTKRPNLSKQDWEKAGYAIADMDRRWQWYIGDWLLAGEAEGYVERGKHKEACALFGISYNTSKDAVVTCRAIEQRLRRLNLSYAHHREVANRDDADELLDWCESEDISIKKLRKEKKTRDEKALENGTVGGLEDEAEDEDTDFAFGANVEDAEDDAPEEVVLLDDHKCRIPTELNEVFIEGPPAIKEQ